jgi:hypothetical protein
MRKLAEPPIVKRALETLKGRARVKRTMWSRRAQEHEAKINSGDIVAIAEVVRDLFRSDTQPEQSYSERQFYEAALDRLSRKRFHWTLAGNRRKHVLSKRHRKAADFSNITQLLIRPLMGAGVTDAPSPGRSFHARVNQ